MINKAKQIMQTLLDNEYQAYLVGGAVRDIILGIQPKDYDIATNALPDVVESLFDKTIPTGKQYGTITVMFDGIGYEVTTFRKEINYTDGRRPDSIVYTNNLKEDLSRRDFRMNALAMDIDGNIIDPFYGQKDLKNKELNSVGNASDRFLEDRLRILRAFRFASKYNLNIGINVIYGMSNTTEDDFDNVPLSLELLSKERIREEFNKIITCDKPSKWLNMMMELGYLTQIIPELSGCILFNQHNPNHSKDVFYHTLDVVDNIEPNLILRLSALFHDISKPHTFSLSEDGVGHFYGHAKESETMTEVIMRRLKYSNEEIDSVKKLVYNHMRYYDDVKPSNCKKLINDIGVNNLDNLFKLQVADTKSCVGNRFEDFEKIFKTKAMCEKIINEKQPLSVKDLCINGYDLMEMGYSGKEVGNKLNELLSFVIEDETKNNKEQLILYC